MRRWWNLVPHTPAIRAVVPPGIEGSSPPLRTII